MDEEPDEKRCVITTERLQLCSLTMEDAEALFKFWSDEEVTRYMDIVQMKTLDEGKHVIKVLTDLEALGKAYKFTIRLIDTDEIIGTCAFMDIDSVCQKAELAYDLGKEYWGKGYITEALKVFIPWGVEKLKLHRIEVMIEPANSASIKVADKLGFEREGLLRDYDKVGDRFCDLYMYSKLFKPVSEI